MTDEILKLSGIRTIPIFPLPLVMMPNELLPLHIFEEKYRDMLTDVVATDRTFGVNLFEPESEFIDRPAIESVGCAAQIRDFDTQDDGRSNIITLGVTRYRIIEYLDRGKSYLEAEVEFFNDYADEDGEAETLADKVFEIFSRIAKAAFKMSGNQGRLPEINRGDSEQLSFLVAAAFNFDNGLKYELIETTSTATRLKRLESILAKTVTQLEESADIHVVSRTNGHSKKKLDI